MKRLPSGSAHMPFIMPGHGWVMHSAPSSPRAHSSPFSLTTSVLTPKNGRLAEPGFMKGMWADPDGARFKETYFGMYPGKFFTGDGCMVDADGDHWLRGRIDDVVNVSGHRLGTAEIEAALVTHDAVAEAAVVGYPHPVKGTGLYTYITLAEGYEGSDDLRKELAGHVRKIVGPIATPDKMQFTPGLPKTRSGKVMRRILRKIAEGRGDELGDVSTLADPSVVEELKENAIA